jgi:TrmH family RNA methyltransferase
MTMTGLDDPFEITSPTNARVRRLVDLRRRKTRESQGITVLEGHHELAVALAAGVTPHEIYYAPELVREPLPIDALERAREEGTTLISLGDAAFRKASYRDTPDGWLAVVDSPARRLDAITLGAVPLVLVCEAIEKPGNLGAMLRTAEAVGADAVVSASPVTDWGNPNVIRASKGTVFAVDVAAAPSDEVVTWARAHGLQIVVATPDAERVVTETDLTAPTAVVVGAEHDGVSTTWLRAADQVARLPMTGRINSLNVSISAAVALYEAVRQRSMSPGSGGLHRRSNSE